MNIGFIGLGKLGLPIAEVMSDYHAVTGYDVLERISSGITIAPSIDQAVVGQEIIFLALPTPHHEQYDGSSPLYNLPNQDFNYEIVKQCLVQIAPLLTSKQILVLISTVLPGTIRREFKNILPEHLQKNLVYNPYLIAMGSEKWDFLNPEMIILGTDTGNEDALQKLSQFYRPMMKNSPQFHTGTWEEAESIKIFYNTFISAKISIVNMILDVAQKLGHLNVDHVTNALAQSTQRIISPAYMQAGMGDGGPCHPRDNIALRWLSEKLELGYDLFDSIIRSREGQAANLARTLLSYRPNVVILGKSYKPNVSLTDGSYSLLVAHYIEKFGGKIHFYDPQTGDNEHSPFAANEQIYLISFWHEWVEHYPFEKGSVVLDPWRKDISFTDIQYIPYGNTR